MTVKGFDVAVVNRDNRGRRINWPAVGEAGEVQFCGIRVLDGTLTDPDGEYNCDGAASISLPFLVYQPFYPRVDARRQAQLLAAIVNVDGIQRAAGDFEVSSNMDLVEYKPLAAVYVNEFEHLTGRPMLIYTGVWFGGAYVPHLLPGRDLWISNPYTPNRPNLPPGRKDWTIWQDAWNKSFKGIYDQTVDSDVFNGTLEQMRSWFGVQGPPPLTLEQRVERLEAEARAHGWQV